MPLIAFTNNWISTSLVPETTIDLPLFAFNSSATLAIPLFASAPLNGLAAPLPPIATNKLINDKIKFVKLISLSNEETFNNLTKAANEYHITIGGHYPAYQKDGKTIRIDIEKVIKSNFKSIEHLAGYISINNDDQLVKAINMTKEYDIYNCPTLDWDIMAYHLQYPTNYQSRLTLQFLPNKISDLLESDYKSAIEKAGGKEKTILAKEKYKAVFDLKLKVLHQLYVNNCLLLMGSDPGNNLQVDGFNIYEEMQYWSKAGIDNFTILKSATINPSRFFLEDDKWVSIEEGKNAELLILQRNPLTDIKNITTIEKTIIGQKVYHNKTLIKLLWEFNVGFKNSYKHEYWKIKIIISNL